MIDMRKLAALDLAFLGYRLILGEYIFAVVFSLALAVFILVRSHSAGQVLLGCYFVCLGINYIPMLWWTVLIGSRERARQEVLAEMAARATSMAKFRRLSLALLVPLLPIAWMVAAGLRNRRREEV